MTARDFLKLSISRVVPIGTISTFRRLTLQAVENIQRLDSPL
jgi:hypothetical protein